MQLSVPLQPHGSIGSGLLRKPETISRRRHTRRPFLFAISLLLPLLLLGGCRFGHRGQAVSIVFTTVPISDEGGPEETRLIAGHVAGARPGQRLVIFSHSEVWWVQPFADRPFTDIRPDGSWQASIHMGTDYAVLLVNPGYRPPLTTATLPQPGGDVIAVANAHPQPLVSGPPVVLHFSGYDWIVRTRSKHSGVRKNVYLNDNAWVDAQGALHLRIARRGNDWSCAEVRLARSFGYGTYVFHVRDTSYIEPSVVLSLGSLDDDDPEQNHREFDMEFSRWADPTNRNAQYVVQPYYVPDNIHRFNIPAGSLTHSVRWEPGGLTFRTTQGPGNSPGRVVSEHTFTFGIPTPGKAVPHMSLYLFGNNPIRMTRETEVIIDRFEYFP